MKSLLAFTAIILVGCTAGVTRYTVKPVYSNETKSMICCQAEVVSGKNVGSVTAHIVKNGELFTVDLQESAVVSSDSIKAAATPVTDVAKAVSDTAITVQKFEGKLP
jgi:hypothetical protein